MYALRGLLKLRVVRFITGARGAVHSQLVPWRVIAVLEKKKIEIWARGLIAGSAQGGLSQCARRAAYLSVRVRRLIEVARGAAYHWCA